MRRGRALIGTRGTAAVALAAALLAAFALMPRSAAAHATRQAGPYEIEMGWRAEPPAAGAPNAVEVTVSAAGGGPVAVPAGALSVEVSYADTAVTLPLMPTEDPGKLEAPLTPTRPGSYAFAVNGTVQGRDVRVRARCSESSFNCVEGSAGPQFPVRDPSPGELAQRLGSEADRVESASQQADDARTVAVVGVVVGALGLVAGAVALVTSLRGRRRREDAS